MGDFDKAKEEIRGRADIVAMVGRFVPLKRRGAYWVGRCPFHDDHSPSLHVNPSLGIYKCFVCGAGGDVFKFLMEHEHQSFAEVLETLARETGVELPRREAVDPERAARGQAARAAMDWATGWFHERLLTTPAALEYARRRGLTEAEIADFHLGFAPDGDALLAAAPAAGHSLESLDAAGLATRNDRGRPRDRFRVRLIFPLQDLSRRTAGFAGRNLRSGRPDIPKYLNSPETEFYRKSQFLFGLGHSRSEISRSGSAVLVEGYMDWFALWRHGIRNAVAVSGTAFTRDQARLLSRQARSVTCFFDADRAGLAAAERALPVLLAQNLEVRIASLGEGTGAKDPDEFLKEKGSEALKERIDKARDWLTYLLHTWGADRDSGFSPSERASLVNRIRTLAESIPEEQTRAQALLKLHGAMADGIDAVPQAPWRGFRPRAEPDAGAAQAPVGPQLRGTSRAEAQLVRVLMEHPALVLDLQDRLHPSRLVHPPCRELYDLLLADAELRCGPPDPRAIGSGLEGPLAAFLTGLFQLFPLRLDEVAARALIADFLKDAEVREMRKKRRRLAQAAQVSGEDGTDSVKEFASLVAEERHLLREDTRT